MSSVPVRKGLLRLADIADVTDGDDFILGSQEEWDAWSERQGSIITDREDEIIIEKILLQLRAF
jgi:hypothetical protein